MSLQDFPTISSALLKKLVNWLIGAEFQLLLSIRNGRLPNWKIFQVFGKHLSVTGGGRCWSGVRRGNWLTVARTSGWPPKLYRSLFIPEDWYNRCLDGNRSHHERFKELSIGFCAMPQTYYRVKESQFVRVCNLQKGLVCFWELLCHLNNDMYAN